MQLDEEKKNKALEKAQSMAKEFNPKEAEIFAQKHQDASWYEQFKLLYDMIMDDEYELSSKVYLSIAGALAYVVFPIDVIPDFIPIMGFIDDAFVLGYVIKTFSDEIERYKTFKIEKGKSNI